MNQSDRDLAAFKTHRNGFKLRNIADKFDVSREAARRMVQRGKEIERKRQSTDPWDELSARLRNALIADLCKPTLDGVLDRYHVVYPLTRIPNIGTKSIDELQAWLVRHDRKPIAQEQEMTQKPERFDQRQVLTQLYVRAKHGVKVQHRTITLAEVNIMLKQRGLPPFGTVTEFKQAVEEKT